MQASLYLFVRRASRLAGSLGFLLLAAGAGVSAARAELTWAQKTVELNADSKASVLEARFRFTNDGTAPVDIRQVETSCGCTTAELTQRHFEPGQGGEIVARYTIGGHVGLQKKMIMVSASDHPGATALTLVVHIPELVRLQPAFVTWGKDEPVAAKTIQVAAVQKTAALSEVSVQSSNKGITAELQPVVEGSSYQITVTPAATGQQLFTTLTVHCKVGGEEKTFRAYASIQGALPVVKVPAVNKITVLPPPTPAPAE